MAAPGKWTVEWYTTAKGEKPLKAFWEGLKDDEENFADALAQLELLEAKGNALRPPRSESLGGPAVRTPRSSTPGPDLLRLSARASDHRARRHGQEEGQDPSGCADADARLPARRRIKAGPVRNSGDNSDGGTISWR